MFLSHNSARARLTQTNRFDEFFKPENLYGKQLAEGQLAHEADTFYHTRKGDFPAKAIERRFPHNLRSTSADTLGDLPSGTDETYQAGMDLAHYFHDIGPEVTLQSYGAAALIWTTMKLASDQEFQFLHSAGADIKVLKESRNLTVSAMYCEGLHHHPEMLYRAYQQLKISGTSFVCDKSVNYWTGIVPPETDSFVIIPDYSYRVTGGEGAIFSEVTYRDPDNNSKEWTAYCNLGCLFGLYLCVRLATKQSGEPVRSEYLPIARISFNPLPGNIAEVKQIQGLMYTSRGLEKRSILRLPNLHFALCKIAAELFSDHGYKTMRITPPQAKAGLTAQRIGEIYIRTAKKLEAHPFQSSYNLPLLKY